MSSGDLTCTAIIDQIDQAILEYQDRGKPKPSSPAIIEKMTILQKAAFDFLFQEKQKIEQFGRTVTEEETQKWSLVQDKAEKLGLLLAQATPSFHSSTASTSSSSEALSVTLQLEQRGEAGASTSSALHSEEALSYAAWKKLPRREFLEQFHPEQIERFSRVCLAYETLEATHHLPKKDKQVGKAVRKALNPQVLSGAGSGAEVTVRNFCAQVPFQGSSKKTTSIICATAKKEGIEALGICPGYVVKKEVFRSNDRSGIPPRQEPLREAAAFQLQEVFQADFGVPETMLLQEEDKITEESHWYSFQEFVPGAKGIDPTDDIELESISEKECHKFFLDLLLHSSDRSFRNMLYREGRIYLIDNGLSLPNPEVQEGVIPTDALYQTLFQWTQLPHAFDEINPQDPIPGVIVNANALEKAKEFEKRVEAMRLKAGFEEPIDRKAYLMTYASILLIQEGIKMGKNLHEISITVQPISGHHAGVEGGLGGEFPVIYHQFFEGVDSLEGPIDEEGLKEAFQNVLGKKPEERILSKDIFRRFTNANR